MAHIVTVSPCSDSRPRSDSSSLVELADGRLLIVYHGYRAGPEGGGDFGDAAIFIRESADGGATWSDERLLLDVDPGDVNAMNPSLALIGDELLLAVTRNHTRTDSSLELRPLGGRRADPRPAHLHLAAVRRAPLHHVRLLPPAAGRPPAGHDAELGADLGAG